MGIIQWIRNFVMDRRSPTVCEKLGIPHQEDEYDPHGGVWCFRCNRLIVY